MKKETKEMYSPEVWITIGILSTIVTIAVLGIGRGLWREHVRITEARQGFTEEVEQINLRLNADAASAPIIAASNGGWKILYHGLLSGKWRIELDGGDVIEPVFNSEDGPRYEVKIEFIDIVGGMEEP